MSEPRHYSAEDIHRMRHAAIMLATPAFTSYQPDEVARTAEGMLVTYMANGTTPDELTKHASDVSEERYAAQCREWERQDAARRARVVQEDSRNLRAEESGVYPPRTRLARFLTRLRGKK